MKKYEKKDQPSESNDEKSNKNIKEPEKKNEATKPENKNEENKPEEIALSNKKVKKMSFGDNHALFAADDGLVFTLWDNKYGQIGKGKKYPYINNPEVLIKGKGEKVKIQIIDKTNQNDKKKNKLILAYKNTSFVITEKNDLLGFGEGKYIVGLSGNVYEPLHILKDTKVFSICQKDGRMLIKSKEINSDEKRNIQNHEIDNIINSGKTNKNLNVSSNQNQEKESQSHYYPETKEYSNSLNTIKIISLYLKRLLYMSHFITHMKEKDLKKLEKALNINLEKEKNTSKHEDKKLKEVWELISKEKTYIVTKEDHKKITDAKLILDELKEGGKSNTKNRKDQSDVENSSIFLYFGKDNDVNGSEYGKSLEKLKRLIDDKSKLEEASVVKNDKNIVELEISTLSYLIPNLIKFKKIQTLIYRLSLNNLILNTYEVNNVLNGFSKIFSEYYRETTKKDILIDKAKMIYEKLIPVFEGLFNGIIHFYNLLERQSLEFTEEKEGKNKLIKSSEKFIYKNLIESVLLSKDLLKKAIVELIQENSSRKQVDKLKGCIRTLIEYKSLQTYLEKINSELSGEEADEKKDDEKKKKEKKKLRTTSLEIDGVLSRLKIIKDKITNEDYLKINEEIQEEENKKKNIEKNTQKPVSIEEKKEEKRKLDLMSYETSSEEGKKLEDIKAMYISCLLETGIYKKCLYYLKEYERSSGNEEKKEDKKDSSKWTGLICFKIKLILFSQYKYYLISFKKTS